MKEELLKGLTEEQVAKIKACKNQEEMLAVAKNEGVELNEDQLEAVSGGCCTKEPHECPACGSSDLDPLYHNDDGSRSRYRCMNCGSVFEWTAFERTLL